VVKIEVILYCQFSTLNKIRKRFICPSNLYSQELYFGFKMSFVLEVKTFSSDPGPLTHALGMHVIRGDGWIELSHEDAINNLIDEYGVRKMPGKFTPLASTKTPLTKADCPIAYSNEERIMKNKPYRRLIGQLLHISGYTRWDIRYSVCFFSTVC